MNHASMQMKNVLSLASMVAILAVSGCDSTDVVVQNDDLKLSARQDRADDKYVALRYENVSERTLLVSVDVFAHRIDGSLIVRAGRKCDPRSLLYNADYLRAYRYFVVAPRQSLYLKTRCWDRRDDMYAAAGRWLRLMSRSDSDRVVNRPNDRWPGYSESCVSYIVVDGVPNTARKYQRPSSHINYVSWPGTFEQDSVLCVDLPVDTLLSEERTLSDPR